MANAARRLAHNAAGDFFVDASCIDCDTCRWMAPATFTRREEQASVHAQPRSEEDAFRALQALVACPTASIGTTERHDAEKAVASFPLPIADGVFHCGFHSSQSFGAASYLVLREDGNVLVDSPRFAAPLVKRIAEMGGVRWMFLTHQDDVADHARFRERFGCERVLHAADVGPDTESVERRLEGTEPVELAPDLVAIPVPGHTEGSTCLLFRGEVLFTGDHLAWSESLGELYAFRDACWMDWSVQIASMRRLAAFDFEWALPGHGRRCRFPKPEMRRRMQNCIAWMERATRRTDAADW
jgi:glyoxylase-like metal-dependent hydrolase (beta-lactamase superfamily II)/ferredoxin